MLSAAELSTLTDEQIDDRLGFQIERVEASIRPLAGVELWQSQGPRVFQTPYAELADILRYLALPAGARIVDLGAGYGRLGIVTAALQPELHFTGYEISTERVAEGRRVYSESGLDPAQLKVADLAAEHFRLPAADAYFLYDFGTREAVEKVLIDLKYLAVKMPGLRVVGRGRRSRDLIERGHPWLSQVNPPRHMGNFSIYRA